jgi:hypothetical protein
MRLLAVLAVIAVAAGAAIAANLALLGNASSANDPVGKLSRHAHLPAAPADVIRPHTGPVEHDGADD